MVGYLNRKPQYVKWVAGLLACCMVVMLNNATGLCTQVAADKESRPSLEENRALVQQAVDDYQANELEKARQGLERAQIDFPENYAVPYYLGLIYLEQGDLKGATTQWQQYLKMDPHSENAQNIRKNMTLLLQRQAHELSKQSVADATGPAGDPLDENTIAVTSFQNLGADDMGPVGKGMAAMLIADLSHVPDLKVVDRIKLQALLNEMEMADSDLVDTKKVSKVGKLLRAGHVTSGSLANLAKGKFIIASAVVDTERTSRIGAQEAKGQMEQFYDLEKKIACQIVEVLGRDCQTMPDDFNRIHTKSLPALLAYSQGLAHFDEQKYDEARDMFQKALEHDPQFDLATTALSSVPTEAMAAMSVSQMIQDASSKGPAAEAGTAVAGTAAAGPAVAGLAVAGSVAAGTAMDGTTGADATSPAVDGDASSDTSASTEGTTETEEETASTSKAGLSPKKMAMVGGAVLVGGLALAGGGGGGGGGGGDVKPSKTLDLTGDWEGTWVDSSGKSVNAKLSLSQTKNSVQGSCSINTDGCMSKADIKGKVSGNEVKLTLQSGGESVDVTANVNRSDKSLSGRWNYTASSLGCANKSGKITTKLTTAIADVHW